MGFELVIGSIDHLKMVATNNCNSLNGLHTVNIIVTPHIVFQVFSSCFLVMDFNSALL